MATQMGRGLVFSALMLVSLVTAAWAQTTPAASEPPADNVSTAVDETDASSRVLSLSRRLMSPFCPGRTLASCSSRGAYEWIGEMRVWVDEGASDEEIVARLQGRVPDFDISADPGGIWDWGLGMLAIAIVTLVMLGAAYRFSRLRRQAAPAEADHGLSEDERQDLEDQLDEELAYVD